jgi:hypothetical protein
VLSSVVTRRALRFYFGLGLTAFACTAVDVTFVDDVDGTGGSGGTQATGVGGTGGQRVVVGAGGAVGGSAGQGGGGEAGMAGQAGAPDDDGCAMGDVGDDCDDEDPCTVDDVCDDGGECHGVALDCDDDNECTADSCDEIGDCVSEPVPDDTPCGDDAQLECDGADRCLAGICDANVAEDDSPCDDGDGQTGADICSSGECSWVPACADGTTGQTFDRMVGCSGIVAWAYRETLCGVGLTPCTAEQWVSRRQGAVPSENYWTADELEWSGNVDACAAWPPGYGSRCSSAYGASPMRVCGAELDAAGNSCQWVGCGLGNESTNDYFGGCGDPNPTAGTLCCW